MNPTKLLAQQLSRPGRLTGWIAGLLWNRRNAALNGTAFDLLDLHPADRVLDIGFGGGVLLNRMAGVVTQGCLAGADISPAIVDSARGRYAALLRAGRLDLRCASVDALPFADASFDKVCSVNSIFYWPDSAAGIKEIRRVLSPGGRLVLCFTCKASLEPKGFAKNIQLYDADEVVELVRDAGFQEIQVTQAADKHRKYAAVVCNK